MAGYHNFSKSNNAVAAEQSGRYPASKCARLLGVPTEWVKRQSTREWHHTSSWYNSTDYYDLEQLAEHLETEEGQAQLLDVCAELDALRQAPKRIWSAATVHWLDWVGTRNHPRAIERSADGATVTDAGGKFVIVTLADGSTFRKGKQTKGFRVVIGGKEISIK